MRDSVFSFVLGKMSDRGEFIVLLKRGKKNTKGKGNLAKVGLQREQTPHSGVKFNPSPPSAFVFRLETKEDLQEPEASC